MRGTCRVCGCTDARACAGGCYWINPEHTLCSRCGAMEEDFKCEHQAVKTAGGGSHCKICGEVIK